MFQKVIRKQNGNTLIELMIVIAIIGIVIRKGKRIPIYGGCQPTLIHRRRAAAITGLFIFKAVIVARPVAVRPLIYTPDSSQTKCSLQLCRRGWKSGRILYVSRSLAVV